MQDKMEIKDYVRGTELAFGDLDLDKEIEVVATSDKGDIVWFYMNEEQARDVVRHLISEFNL